MFYDPFITIYRLWKHMQYSLCEGQFNVLIQMLQNIT